MKLALLLFAATVGLTACRHAEVARQQPADAQAAVPVNPNGTFHGHKPTEAEARSFTPLAPTPEQAAADRAIAERLVGTWTATDSSDSAEYPVLVVRSDGTYAVRTAHRKVVSEGIWAVDRGVLLLKERNVPPAAYFGFHVIEHIDDHNLVCGIDISVAGRLRFTR